MKVRLVLELTLADPPKGGTPQVPINSLYQSFFEAAKDVAEMHGYELTNYLQGYDGNRATVELEW